MNFVSELYHQHRYLVFMVIYSTLISGVLSQLCPSPNGFYADPLQCDKYISCVNDLATDKLCPDGLIFNSRSPLYERCDLPYLAKCGNRTILQEPKPTKNCRRQNGLFPHNDPRLCGNFWSCQKGVASLLRCPEGLAFKEPTGSCEWPEGSQKCEYEGHTQRTTAMPNHESNNTSIPPRRRKLRNRTTTTQSAPPLNDEDEILGPHRSLGKPFSPS